ncbi:MAG: hypothetical protein D6679_04495 [Candidatus Hydrogenedentota bacterium]|nr:MAG: hypothetical protein D6679_04495 [Candidatus Hydrogenedentota bacterium]
MTGRDWNERRLKWARRRARERNDIESWRLLRDLAAALGFTEEARAAALHIEEFTAGTPARSGSKRAKRRSQENNDRSQEDKVQETQREAPRREKPPLSVERNEAESLAVREKEVDDKARGLDETYSPAPVRYRLKTGLGELRRVWWEEFKRVTGRSGSAIRFSTTEPNEMELAVVSEKERRLAALLEQHPDIEKAAS